jgi:1-acyl-sn-glycerol-3-phosphate acyltransferase
MRTAKTIREGRPYSPLWRLISVIVLVPLLSVLIRDKREGRENVPGEGGVIFAPNHLSYADWAPDALFFRSCGRYPTFLIKASAFEVKGIGALLRKTGQLPVHRGRADGAVALREAEKRLAEGAAVVIYPEGTVTRDPGLWPMAAKTGVARLALATGVPVVPVAHWGTHEILPYGARKPRLFPRKTVRTVAGRPVDLSQWAGQQKSAKALRTATETIMAEVTALVGQLRDQTPPAVPYDPRSPVPRTGSAACDAPALSPSPEAAPLAQVTPENLADPVRRAGSEPLIRTRTQPPASAGVPLPWRTVDDEDGLWSFGVYGEADADTALVLLPALGVPARYYAPLVRGWLDEDMAVIQADFLASRVRRDPAGDGRDGFAALVERCVPAILGTVRDSLPRAAPVIVGHSLGGQLGLIAAARFAQDLPVVLAASGSAGYRVFPGWRRWAALAGSQAIRLTGRVLGYWPGDRLGFGGPQPAAVMRDWSYTVRTGRYRAATGSFDYETALRDYRGEVLAIGVEHDVLAPRTATQALLAKAPAARVTRRNYTASGGTARPGAHFTWVKDQPGLASIIAEWARPR